MGNPRERFSQSWGNRRYCENQGLKEFWDQNRTHGRSEKNFRRLSRGRIRDRGRNRQKQTKSFEKNSFNSFRQHRHSQVGEETLNTGSAGVHIELTAFSKKFYSTGYPNHSASKCESLGWNSWQDRQIPLTPQSKIKNSPTLEAVPKFSIISFPNTSVKKLQMWRITRIKFFCADWVWQFQFSIYTKLQACQHLKIPLLLHLKKKVWSIYLHNPKTLQKEAFYATRASAKAMTANFSQNVRQDLPIPI